MDQLTDIQSDDAKKLLKTAIAVVFAGVTVSLETEDNAKATEVVVSLWPAALDLSGYQIAAECVLALAGVANISNDVLAGIATIAMAEANPTGP